MPIHKLTYFNGRGRGELSRMIFVAADEPFVDKRIEFSDWPTVKKDTPQGTLPVLDIDDGQHRICQSISIVRYLAREFDVYGKGNDEMVQVDEILDTLLDVFGQFVTIVFNPDKEEMGTKMEEFNKTTLPKYLGFLQDLVKETGTDGFAVGSSLTLGDLALYVYIENIQAQDKLEKFPLLAKNREKIAGIPRIAKYLKNRPKTQF